MEIAEQIIKETRTLRYKFEDHEIEQMGKDLSEMVQYHSEVELEKKSVMKTFNEMLKAKMKIIHETAKKINDGHEDREVSCQIEFNTPVYGRKKIIRLDTGDYWDEPMEDDEFNLFNQSRDDVFRDRVKTAQGFLDTITEDYAPWSEEE